MSVMLAREKWQIRTIKMLERVFAERCRQMELHGTAMSELPDGIGPDELWLEPLSGVAAAEIQEEFRADYESRRATPGGQYGQLTRMHLVREEIAEAFERYGDDPEFINEILQVAALLVQWAEIKDEEQELI